MIKLLEVIFQGYIEWMYGMTLECWEYFSSQLMELMSMDFDYLEAHVPIIPTIRQAMLAIGWALLLGNLIFQAGKTMLSGLGFEGEDPKLLFTRTFVFAFLLLASPQICDVLLNMTARVIELLELPSAVNITSPDESSFVGLTGAWLLVVICGVIVMFKTFKLILEMAERYVILALLTITSPLAFGVGGSRNTSEIFSGWCKMYGSMCLLTALNVVFFKLLLSVLSYVPSGLDVLPWMVLVLTITKVAKKADAIVTRIGLNPAITGDSLGRSFPGMLTMMVARTAISNVARSVGKSGGNAGESRSGNGGGPRTSPGGTGNGGRSRAAAGTGANGTQSVHNSRSASYQKTAQSSAQQANQQETTTQNTTAQTGAAQSNAYESNQQNVHQSQTGGPTLNEQRQTVQGRSAGPQGGQSRKTAVPPGTRRSPSHVKAQPGVPGKRGGVTAISAGRRSETSPVMHGGAQVTGTVPKGAADGRSMVAGQSSLAEARQRAERAQYTSAPRSGTAGTHRKTEATHKTATAVFGLAGSEQRASASNKAAAGVNGTAGKEPTSRIGQAAVPTDGRAGNAAIHEQGGLTGRAASVPHAEARPIMGNGASIKQESVGNESRFTSVSASGIQQSAVTNTARMRGQNQVTVQRHNASDTPGPSPQQKPASSRFAHPVSGESKGTDGRSRMTQRPEAGKTSAGGPTPGKASPERAGTQSAEGVKRSGTAGNQATKAVGQQRGGLVPQAARQGRNTPPSRSTEQNAGQTPSTVRQERKNFTPRERPLSKNGGSIARPGMAGTTRQDTASQPTARSSRIRASEQPTRQTRDSLGIKHNTQPETENTAKDSTVKNEQIVDKDPVPGGDTDGD